MNRFTYGLCLASIASCAPSHAEPPAEREAGASQQTSVQTFAVDSVLLGDVLHLGDEPTSDACKSFGYDLDGVVTDSTSMNVCTLFGGAPRINQRDGLDGRDNAFGESLLPILETSTATATPSDNVTTDIGNGRWTIQLRITGLDNTSTRDDDGLHLDVLTSDVFDNGRPTFDETTDWPIGSDSLDANGAAIARFDDAYVANGSFVAGASESATSVTIHFVIGGIPIPLRVRGALVTFQVGADATLTNGLIAGVLDREELAQTFRIDAARISTSLCGAASDGIVDQIRQTAASLIARTHRTSRARASRSRWASMRSASRTRPR